MNASPLLRLPLEIQREILHNAILVKDADFAVLPLDLSILRTCKQLRNVGLDVLRHEYKWIRCIVYSCVDYRLVSKLKIKLFHRHKVLFEQHVKPKPFSLDITVCSCTLDHVSYQTDHSTNIIIPFETSVFAQLCENLEKASEERAIRITFELDGLDLHPQMNLICEVIWLKMHRQDVRIANGNIGALSVHRAFEDRAPMSRQDSHMEFTIAFLGKQLRSARAALHATQYQSAINRFFHVRDVFSETYISGLIKTPDAWNNTIAILYAYLGFAAFQAHCRMILVRLTGDWYVSNQIRLMCLRAAIIYPGMSETERLGVYLWNMACIGILIKSAPSISCVEELDSERRHYFRCAKRLREAEQWDVNVFRFFEDQSLEDMTMSTDLVLFVDSMIWKGSKWLSQLWDLPRTTTATTTTNSTARTNWSRWQDRQVDVVKEFDFELSDDMDAILLRTISQEA